MSAESNTCIVVYKFDIEKLWEMGKTACKCLHQIFWIIQHSSQHFMTLLYLSSGLCVVYFSESADIIEESRRWV